LKSPYAHAMMPVVTRLPLITLVVVVLAVLAAPLIAPHDPMRINSDSVAQPPDTGHPLGTDGLGRDVLSRVLYGGQRTLLVASLATLVAALPGLLIGLSVGAASAQIDRIGTIVINSLLAIPALVLALVILTVAGQGAWQLALATGFAQIAAYAQVTRAATRSVRAAGFVEGAAAIGATWSRIVFGHILPNASPTLLSYTGVVFSYSIINSAALSFLGLGGQPGIPDWGVILAEGRDVFRTAPWVAIVPGLAITVVVMSVNTLVDKLAASR
jgi:peptide/nickel transport system permease protein